MDVPEDLSGTFFFTFNQTKNKMAEKYTLKERKRILSEYIELLVKNGYDIKWLMGKPLTYYNFDGVKKVIKDLQKELDNS